MRSAIQGTVQSSVRGAPSEPRAVSNLPPLRCDSSVRTCVQKHGQLRTANGVGWSWDEVEKEEIHTEPKGGQTLTTKKRRRKLPLLASLVSEDRDLMKALLREVRKEVLEGGMTEFLGAAPRGSAQKAGKATGLAIAAGVR